MKQQNLKLFLENEYSSGTEKTNQTKQSRNKFYFLKAQDKTTFWSLFLLQREKNGPYKFLL